MTHAQVHAALDGLSDTELEDIGRAVVTRLAARASTRAWELRTLRASLRSLGLPDDDLTLIALRDRMAR